MRKAKILTILGIVFGLAISGYAQDIPLIEPKVENGIRYITGGVGLEEREAMQEAFDSGDYNLKIVLATKNGPYLSLVPVRITDATGKVMLETDQTGPWLYVNLPRGKYKITATYNRMERTRTVSVNGGMNMATFYWDYDWESPDEVRAYK